MLWRATRMRLGPRYSSPGVQYPANHAGRSGLTDDWRRRRRAAERVAARRCKRLRNRVRHRAAGLGALFRMLQRVS